MIFFNRKGSLLVFILLYILSGCNDGTLKVEYFPTGETKEEYYLKDGMVNGIAKVYHKNGSIESEVNFENGKKNGIGKLYYEDGHILAIVNYRNDLQVDTMRAYYDDGKLMEISHYREGNKTGQYSGFFNNGAIKIQGYCVNGRMAGIMKYYDSLTGLLSKVRICDSATGNYHESDSTDFVLSKIAAKDSDLHISIPSSWIVKYNLNVNYRDSSVTMPICALKTNKNIDTTKYKIAFHGAEVKKDDTAQTMIAVLINKNDDETITPHTILSNVLDNLEKAHAILKRSEIKDITIGGEPAVSVRVIGVDNGVQSGITMAFIRHKKMIYQISGKTSLNKFAYYADLYDEIINGITFAKK